MKKQNYLKIGIAVLLSGVLLFAIALTGNAAGNGYEQLKMLLNEEPVQLSSSSIHTDLSISDNGTSVLQAAGDIKADMISKNMSGQFNIAGAAGAKSFEVFQKGDTVLFHLTGSENWYQTIRTENDRYDGETARGQYASQDRKSNRQLRDAVLDVLMGDLKDQVTLDEANGLRTFSLTMDKSNMPLLIQTAFSAGKMHSGVNDQPAFDMANLPAELKAAADDMMVYRNLIDISGERTLEKIKISLTVDQNNQPQAIELSTNFSGVSEDGTAHAYEINCKAALSGINATVPDEAKADPSVITTIDASRFETAAFKHR